MTETSVIEFKAQEYPAGHPRFGEEHPQIMFDTVVRYGKLLP